MVIRRVAPLSVAKISGALYALMGLIVGALFSLASVAGGLMARQDGGAMFGALFGVGAIVLFPILYGVLGFLVTLVAAWLYNLAAGWVGGVEIDVA
jgi:hypothetical protein